MEVFYNLAINKQKLRIDVVQGHIASTAKDYTLDAEKLYSYDDLINDIIRKIMHPGNNFSAEDQYNFSYKLKKDAKDEKKKIISDQIKKTRGQYEEEIEPDHKTKFDISNVGLIITCVGVILSFLSVFIQLTQNIPYDQTTNEFYMNLLVVVWPILIIMILTGVTLLMVKVSTRVTSIETIKIIKAHNKKINTENKKRRR